MMRGFPGIAVHFLHARVRALRAAVVRDLEDLNRLIGHVLLGGVLLSLAVLLSGLIIAAVEGSGYPSEAVPPGRVLQAALQLRPEGLMSLGVILLILTPVGRVVLSLLAFVRRRDRAFVAITAIVLVNLLSALVFVIV